MAVVVGEAAVRLRPETSGFAKEAESEVDSSLPGIAGKAAGFFVAAFAAVKIGQFLGGAISQASDLSESASKVGVVFGDSAGKINAFASTASTSLGLTEAAALGAAGTFGNLLRSVGLSQDASADMSTAMLGLAGDLASFNNTDPTEALDALRSGLIGETDPLKAYGVNLNAAAIGQEAVRLGLSDSATTLTDAAKAQAAYSLIMQQTSLAQGDFARTSAGLANQQRIAKAQFGDLSADIGGLFVPALGNAATLVTGHLMPALLGLTSGLPNVGKAIGSVGDVFRAAFDGDDEKLTGLLNSTLGFGNGISALAADAGNFSAIFQEAMSDGKAGVDLLAEESLAGLAARAGVAAHSLEQSFAASFMSIRASAAPAFAGLMDAAAVPIASVKASLGSLFDGLDLGGGGGLAGFAGMIGGALSSVVPMISGVLTSVIAAVQPMLPIIADVFMQLVPIVQQVFSQIGPVISQILPVIMEVSGLWREVFLGAFQALLPVLPVIVGAIGQLVGTLAGTLGPVLSLLVPVISAVVSAISGALVGVVQALVPVIPPLVAALGSVVTILAGAFMGVLQALLPIIPVLVTALGSIAGILAGALGTALQAILPIFPVLAQVIGQVVTMVAGGLSSVLQALIPIIPPIVSALAMIAQVLVGALMSALQAILPVIPLLVGVLLQLVQAAIVPLLPILPLLANLLATIIAAIAPLIPVVIQVVVLIIQLAVAALMPLMPVILVVANLITMLIAVLVPIIQVLVTIVGGFIGMAATIISVVIGFVGMILGIWTGLIGAVTSIFGNIFGVIRGVFTSISEWVSGIVSNIAGAISGAFSGVIGAIEKMFSGISGTVSNAFSGAVGAVKGALNAVIGAINSAIETINSKLIGTANKIPGVNIPDIPSIPKLHSGGVFDSYSPTGEGLALLRDRELVATPEQQATANDLLGQLLAGRVTTRQTSTVTGTGGQAITVNNTINQAPGEPIGSVAARTSQAVVWRLNGGITRTVGQEVYVP